MMSSGLFCVAGGNALGEDLLVLHADPAAAPAIILFFFCTFLFIAIPLFGSLGISCTTHKIDRTKND